MRIDFLYATATNGRNVTKNLVLGDDANGEFINGYLPALEMEVQISEVPRADYKNAFGRGNAAHPITFEVQRSLVDYPDAVGFMHTHIQALKDHQVGSLSVQVTGPSGASVVFYQTAIIQRVTPNFQRGVFFITRYDLWCSGMNTSGLTA